MRQKISILGSTGSIGVQTLEVIKQNEDLFEVTSLCARRNWELLARQAIDFDVDTVVISDEAYYPQLKDALAAYPIKVFAGEASVCHIASSSQTDVVVNALVGYAGLPPTIAAIGAHKKIALANKETLVVGGELVMKMARENSAPILPIDSEHSAIFQCLVGEMSPLSRLIITCSGGAFRDLSREELQDVSVEEALRHPMWNMGAKITVDSSTLVNKGFEVIEARWLFDVEPSKISVIQHPQSIVHSMVEFEDGAIKAQLGTPDMRTPISYALMFPHRAHRAQQPFSFVDNPTLTFESVDRQKYPALDIAYDTLGRGGNSGCVMNAANDVAVAAFLNHRCHYLDIVRTIEHALGGASFVARPTVDDLVESNREVRILAKEFLHVK